MLSEGDHVKISQHIFNHHGIFVVPGELVIKVVSEGDTSSSGKKLASTAHSFRSASIASSSVATFASRLCETKSRVNGVSGVNGDTDNPEMDAAIRSEHKALY